MSVPLTLLGLLERGPSHGYVYVITEIGAADVQRWLAEPVPPEPDLWIDHTAARLGLLSRAVRR